MAGYTRRYSKDTGKNACATKTLAWFDVAHHKPEGASYRGAKAGSGRVKTRPYTKQTEGRRALRMTMIPAAAGSPQALRRVVRCRPKGRRYTGAPGKTDPSPPSAKNAAGFLPSRPAGRRDDRLPKFRDKFRRSLREEASQAKRKTTEQHAGAKAVATGVKAPGEHSLGPHPSTSALGRSPLAEARFMLRRHGWRRACREVCRPARRKAGR